MAWNGDECSRIMVDDVIVENQTACGILVFHRKQYLLGDLGYSDVRLCINHDASRFGGPQYQGTLEDGATEADLKVACDSPATTHAMVYKFSTYRG
jgi:hypothetical protein